MKIEGKIIADNRKARHDYFIIEKNERYNFYLKLLNEIDDSYVMYFSYLLSNKHLYIT